MINNFTSVITWFKDITTSLLGWFFDTSNINKILLFIVPFLVIAVLFVLFDFIIPMVYDLPQWNINKKLYAMSPRNTYALAVNKHLIPRKYNNLNRFGFLRGNFDYVKSYSSKELKAFSSRQIAPFKTADMRSFKTANMQSFKTADMRSFGVADMRSFGVADMRSFKVSDMRSFKVADLRALGMHYNYYKLYTGGTDRIRIGNSLYLRVASPSFRIATYSMTKLGHAAVANARCTMQGGHDLAVDEETGEVSAPSEL